MGMFHRKTKALTSGPDFTPRLLTLTPILHRSLSKACSVGKWPDKTAWQEDHPIKDRPANGTTVQEHDDEDAANCLWGET